MTQTKKLFSIYSDVKCLRASARLLICLDFSICLVVYYFLLVLLDADLVYMFVAYVLVANTVFVVYFGRPAGREY